MCKACFPSRMCQRQRQLYKNRGENRSMEILGLNNVLNNNNNVSHKLEESEYAHCRTNSGCLKWFLGEKKFSGH